ncbi:MAG: cytochrome c [Bacteroidota bacterium]
MKTLLKTILAVAGVSFLLSAGTVEQAKPWVAPSWTDTIKNPLTGNVPSIAEGKKLYSQYCSVCHGDKGKGDGIAAAGLTPKPANHTSAEIQKQSDGAIFWKTTTGRPPMAGYEKTFTATQRWQLVNYIRTLKKP